MNKMIFLLILSILSITLIGCGDEHDPINGFLETYVEESIADIPEIENDSEYVQYKGFEKKGGLTEEGFYKSEDVDDSILKKQDLNHISFGKNSFISIEYYSDPEMTTIIDKDDCYMSGDDCIYYSVESIQNPNTDAYSFSGFKVLRVDDDGTFSTLSDNSTTSEDLAFQIPSDFKGEEISLLPLGQYEERIIILDDYFKDINGQANSIDGSWRINDTETDEGSISIDATTPYTVSYQYNPVEYEYVYSSPDCLYNNQTTGEITFEEFTADQGINNISIELRKRGEGLLFDPSKYLIDHADIEYSYLGETILEPRPIPDGDFIDYRITNVEDGYRLTVDSIGRIDIGSDIRNTIQKFVCAQKEVLVKLPQPKRGGSIAYLLDNKEITDNQIITLVGNVIRMKFYPKNGWSCKEEDNLIYRVIDKEVQTVTLDGRSVENAFFESDFLPTLKLKLDKSVGTMKFSIEASGIDDVTNVTDLTFSDAKYAFEGKIATGEDLRISVNGAKKDNTAVKFTIEKKKDNGDKSVDIQYTYKSPSHVDVVLYDVNDSTITDEIEICAEIVDVIKIETSPIQNAYINLSTNDLTKNRVLKEGDYIEDNRSVELKIVPKTGYYIQGSDSDKYYVDAMKYSKYVSDLKSIIEKHPAKRICHVTLSSEDEYGNVSYKIDGNTVTPGQFNLREESKLEMIYEITDDKHTIMRNDDGFFENIWNKTKSKTKESITIPIGAGLDNQTIRRKDYIKVQE